MGDAQTAGISSNKSTGSQKSRCVLEGIHVGIYSVAEIGQQKISGAFEEGITLQINIGL